MFSPAFFQGLVQLFQELALMLGQLDWSFYGDVAVQVAGEAGANAFDALAAQPELLAGLGALGQVDGGFAIQGGHTHFTTQSSRGEADGHGAMQVVAIALEHLVFLQTDFNVQVAWGAAIGAGLAVAGAANPHAVVNTGGDGNFQCFLALDLALAVTR